MQRTLTAGSASSTEGTFTVDADLDDPNSLASELQYRLRLFCNSSELTDESSEVSASPTMVTAVVPLRQELMFGKYSTGTIVTAVVYELIETVVAAVDGH